MIFSYRWKHLPSGVEGVSQIFCLSWDAFYEKLAEWNRLGFGQWQYCEKL